MDELCIKFHPEKCIQCHACEAACKSWRQLEPGVKLRRVHCLWQGSFPDTTLSTLTVSCMHCTVPACMTQCPTDAIYKRLEDGAVLVDRERCTGCRKCAKACPIAAPQFGGDGKMQKCDNCITGPKAADGPPACVMTCPTQALEPILLTADEKAAEEAATIEKYRLMVQ